MSACIYPYPFIDNDAFREMSQIVEGARERPKIPYETEQHHIVPKSLNPALLKEPSNLVHLTCREHYRIHMLLPECIHDPEHRARMLQAAWFMSHIKTRFVVESEYGILRWKYIDMKRNPSPERRARMSATAKKLMANQEIRNKISRTLVGKKSYVRTSETREKVSAWQRGRKLTPEHCRNMGDAHKGLNVKWWIVVNPQQEKLGPFENLFEFCKQRDLDTATMIAVSKGRRKHHKGWTCQQVPNPSS